VKKAQLFKHFQSMTYIVAVLALSAAFLTANAAEPTTPPKESGKLYLPSSDAMADVETAMNTARKNNKLALVVMGANWCHDSRALASRLYREPLKSLVDEHYETVFVDVGFLDKGKDVISRLGPPVYYATPTVLIVDPISHRLVNEQDRHRWAEAYSISMEESVDYFQRMAKTDLMALREEETISDDLQNSLTKIDMFEQQQANRLYRAYAMLGPMLKAYKAGDKKAFSEKNWNEVRDFRYKVAHDVDVLRAQAHERSGSGDHEISLIYPEYPAFSWD